MASLNQRITNASESKTGRYTQGGLVDRYRRRLDWWERYEMDTATDDITVTITKQYEFRPDLVAYAIYEKATLAWLVLQYNKIVDINTEFVVGKVLKLPTPARAQAVILSQKTGGNIVE